MTKEENKMDYKHDIMFNVIPYKEFDKRYGKPILSDEEYELKSIEYIDKIESI